MKIIDDCRVDDRKKYYNRFNFVEYPKKSKYKLALINLFKLDSTKSSNLSLV